MKPEVIQTTGAGYFRQEVSGLRSGMYFILLEKNGEKLRSRFVVN
jgi:hypothetical protein